MRLHRLFTVSLVLLQSGLAVGSVHAHPDHGANSVPHLHMCELIALVTPTEHDEHDGEGDHGADAVDLSDVITPGAPPAPELAAVDLAPAGIRAAVEAPTEHPFPLGVPPSTAGPRRPLYLTFCTLTI